MFRVVSTPCDALALHSYIVWPYENQWRLFQVIRRWSDGVLVRCSALEPSREIFLPRHRWVAGIDSAAFGSNVQPGEVLELLASSWKAPSLTVRLSGLSMASMVPDGAELSVVPLSANALAVGQVLVVAEESPRWVAHRLHSIHQRQKWSAPQIVTKGDAFKRTDAPISAEQILGRVAQVTYEGRSWNPEAWSTRCSCFLRDRSVLWSQRIRRSLPF